MEPRISIITLGVADLDKAYEFYANGLGFPTNRNPELDIVFFQMQGTCLALYPHAKLAEDVGERFEGGERAKFSGITLAYNARTKEEVDEVVKQAVAAGGKLEKPPQDASWGGYSGYFSDPDGHLWEVAWGAFEFNDDGSLEIP
ncbi:MAG: putative lactoylglutathione lyase [Pirellulaceae bacterium]|jgi:predicted lactoylglutathione lyase